MTVTRQHVERIMRITGLDDAEMRQVIDGLSFPAELDDVVRAFGKVGVTKDRLYDEMGASP